MRNFQRSSRKMSSPASCGRSNFLFGKKEKWITRTSRVMTGFVFGVGILSGVALAQPVAAPTKPVTTAPLPATVPSILIQHGHVYTVGAAGTLENGKDADVVIWDGDPFSVYTHAEKVFIDGALLFDRDDPKLSPRSDFEIGQEDNANTGGAGQ